MAANHPANSSVSGFEVSRNKAMLALAIFGFATLLCVGIALTNDPTPPFVPPPGATTDLDVFRRIVDRVHAGESFHSATQQELRTHDYPTRSVFNWRTPVYAWWLGSDVGWRFGAGLLALLVILSAVMFSRDLIDASGLLPASIGIVFYIGATAWCFGAETHLFTEIWAGILIAISVCAYHRDQPMIAITAGLVSLFYRELALPYCVVCMVIALRTGRKTEFTGWVAGIAAFLVFMAWHHHEVQARLTPADLALTGGWIRFGGLRFVLSTAQTNIFLMPLPLWCTGVYLPLCLLGLFGSRSDSARRVSWTVAAYLAGFAVIGNPFNFYWGFLDAPLLATGIASAPAVLKTLVARAFPGLSGSESLLAEA